MINKQLIDVFRRCEQCGTCTASCKLTDVSDFNIRKLIRRAQLDLFNDESFLSGYPWLCTLCSRCSELCIEGLEISKLVLLLRKLALKNNMAPDGACRVLMSIKKFASQYSSLIRTKSLWINPNLRLSTDSDILYWIGCISTLMAPNIARATAKVLTKLDLDFKVRAHKMSRVAVSC